jgi:O-antigen ligase
LINVFTVVVAPSYLEYHKPFGSGTDAAYFGMSLLVLIANGKRIFNNEILRMIAIGVFGGLLILITARSAVLAFAIALGSYLALSQGIKLKRLLFTVSGMTVVAMLVVLLATRIPTIQDLLYQRFMPLLEDYEEDDTSKWRLAGWTEAISSIQSNPFTGVGFGGYAERRIFGTWQTVSLHNAYLDFLYTMGLIGFLPFTFIIITGLKLSYSGFKSVLMSKGRRNIYLSLFLILLFLSIFIGFNAEMSYSLSGSVMWLFLGSLGAITLSDRHGVRRPQIPSNLRRRSAVD